MVAGQTTVNYTESNEIIANPERGLQKYSITNSNYNSQSNYSNLSQTALEGMRAGSEKATVLFRYFLLDSYFNTDISTTYLNNIQNDFNVIRASGLKCIVRFSYSNGQSTAMQQPLKSQILKHIAQLEPVLSNNKDVILSHQAGFIGTWGEWYYTNSDEFGDKGIINQTQWNNRKEIVDAMLKATPPEIPLQVRYPAIKKTMYGSSPLTSKTAYQNSPNARIGFFNDAFLNNYGDMGTFSVSSPNQSPVGTSDYTYLSNESLYTPLTGETNGLNPPRTDGSNAVLEMNASNWTCLNRDYFGQVWLNWINSGHYDEILKKLGYRFVLTSSAFELKENKLNFEVNIKNIGFARLILKRQAYLILKNTQSNKTFTFLLQTDPRTWENSLIISQVFDIGSLPDGTYNSFLFLPDNNEPVSNRPEYAIQFANLNTWNKTNGYNELFQQVIKKSPNDTITTGFRPDIRFEIFSDPILAQAVLNSTIFLKNVTLSVMNMNGQIVHKTHNISGKSFIINRNNLPAGLYYICLTDNKTRLTAKKLIF